jgi:hypothetical protein
LRWLIHSEVQRSFPLKTMLWPVHDEAAQDLEAEADEFLEQAPALVFPESTG